MLKLKTASLDWALNHIESHGDTDIFPPPFEYQAIRLAWPSSLPQILANEDMLQWQTKPYRRCLSPKHRYGFRVSTQLDPLDTLVFLALVYEIGGDIEAARVPAGSNIVFSYRFAPDAGGGFFDTTYHYEAFQKHTAATILAGAVPFVVVADIADFYPRLYSHPLENALKACTKRTDHAKSIMELLSSWNFSISYGIPVGPSASRLLAELAINDVDQALLSEGRTFCRYSDDYRIFCNSEREAYDALAFLANTLFENHGLTLQQHKTEILTAAEFTAKYIPSDPSGTGDTLSSKFAAIIQGLGKGPYDPIDYAGLDGATKQKIDDLGLERIIDEQLSRDTIEIAVTRTVLSMLTQIQDHSCLDRVVDNLPKLYAVLKDALEYVQSFGPDLAKQAAIGAKLIDALESTVVGHLEFHRSWVLSTFTRDRQWDNEGRFVSLMNHAFDEFTRRELTLALGRAAQSHWFKTRKRGVLGLPPWERRAFIAAASCLPGDEHKHWTRSLEGRLDPLERVVAAWARQNKFA